MGNRVERTRWDSKDKRTNILANKFNPSLNPVSLRISFSFFFNYQFVSSSLVGVLTLRTCFWLCAFFIFLFLLSVRSGGKTCLWRDVTPRRGGMKLESNDDALEFTCSSICGDAQIDGEDRFAWWYGTVVKVIRFVGWREGKIVLLRLTH